MNIIEAVKALEAGRIVLDPDGWPIHADSWGFILHRDDSDYLSYVRSLLSEKWTVIDE